MTISRCSLGGGTTWGRQRTCALVVVAGACMPSAAQPCQPPVCGPVSVADGSGFVFPSAADFVPDRRPAVGVNLFGGSCLNPPTGGPDWWLYLGDDNGNSIVDAVDELIARLDALHDDGWRRVILHLPAGSLAGYLMSSSQWWPMPPSKRVGLTGQLAAWLDAHPDATLGVYSGFQINDPCSLCMAGCFICSDCGDGGGCAMCPDCHGASVARLPDTTSSVDMCVVAANLEPWMNLGVYEMWFDGSSGADAVDWFALLRFAGNPDYMNNVKFVGEPIPNGGLAGGANIPIPGAIKRLGYMSLRRYLEVVGGDAPKGLWAFDKSATEIHVGLRSTDFCVDADVEDADPCTGCPDFCGGIADGVLIDVVYGYVARGYIPYARWSRSEEMIRRIYDMSPETIPCPADLDADGDVDFHDLGRLSSQIGLTTGATLYHGDLDFDDDVDVFDLLILLNDPAMPGPCSTSSP